MRTDTLCFNTNGSFFLFQRQVKCMIDLLGILPQNLFNCLKKDGARALLRATKMATHSFYLKL